MASKREPVAVVDAEDYRIVKFTHDVELATKLMREALLHEWGPLDDVGRPQQLWVRIQGCLPNSFGACMGWSYAYHHAKGPGRGVFPAVVFWS